MVRSSFFDFSTYTIPIGGSELSPDSINEEVKIVVLIDESDINEANEKLISGILNATKTPEGQILKVTIPQSEEVAIGKYMKSNTKRLLLSFGIPPKRMGFNMNRIPYYEHKMDQLSIFYCHSLTEMSSNQSYKKQLWTFLQQYLGL